MPTNFHRTAFDDATLLKLEIYRRYLRDWLPVFIQRRPDNSWSGKINVFDFFCGPGKDSEGRLGSPLIAIEECKDFATQMQDQNKKVQLHFMDGSQKKIASLGELLQEERIPPEVQLSVDCKKFGDAYEDAKPKLSKAANLIFIDQCGVKEVNEETFKSLISLKGTDFLFFIASSYFVRFRDSTEFKKYLDTTGHIDDDMSYGDAHRKIADMYRQMIPDGAEYYLASFSLKKGSNIYGLVFGSGNVLGILKFLNICWSLDPERGTANFDIDNDQLPKPGEPMDLFKDNNKSSKVVEFQNEVERLALAGKFQTDRDVFVYALENGFIPTQHAKPVIVRLIKSKVLSCDGNPRLSKDCIKEPRRLSLG